MLSISHFSSTPSQRSNKFCSKKSKINLQSLMENRQMSVSIMRDDVF